MDICCFVYIILIAYLDMYTFIKMDLGVVTHAFNLSMEQENCIKNKASSAST